MENSGIILRKLAGKDIAEVSKVIQLSLLPLLREEKLLQDTISMILVISARPNAQKVYEHFGFKKVRIEWKKHEDGRKSHNVWMELYI